MNDYERVARVIRYLDESANAQPDLTTLASYAGLSPYHFHRLFSRWAGVTPKDFLQCLTVSHARMLLRQGNSVLATALDSGLSGPGRLHDLCVSLEAASPGEIKSGGEGLTIVFGFADCPFGRCLLGESPRGLCHLAFANADDDGEIAALQAHWPRARLVRDNALAARIAGEIFDAPRGDSVPRSALRAFVRGTPFQVKVWRALLEVRAGSLVSYRGLAAAVGMPTAARAVGSAVARNSLAFLVPCHRVIRETGVVGDYRWGTERKRAAIAWENAPRRSDSEPSREAGRSARKS